MIKLTAVDKTFHAGKENQVLALKQLNLNINAGEFVVIVGANGSGKSTLLNCISGSVLLGSGTVFLDGTNATRLAEHQRSKWIARVFQNPLSGTAPDLSILENFRLAALRTTSKKLQIGINAAFADKVKGKISLLGMKLEDKIHQPMGSLSGGQRQALTLLMAVMADVKILLLDEPTAALDPRSAETVMQTADKLIADYKLTAILITHNMKEAFHYGSRIIQLAEGQLLRDLNREQKSILTHTAMFDWFM